jgi:hypothetical protein
MKWEQSKVDEVVKKFREMKSPGSHIVLYERYGEVEVEKGKETTYPYRRTFIADVGEDSYREQGDQRIVINERGVELSSEDWDEHPYWEFHLRKIPGRWLGIGVVERLKEPQIRLNEIANLQAKNSYWEALRIFFSRDNTINRNLQSDVRSGEVMTGESEIALINTSGNSGPFFNDSHLF